MTFLKYMHIERLGTDEVEDILEGEVYIFPKIDGTNASVWWDKERQVIRCGSRNRELSLENDNAGFMNWAVQQANLVDYFKSNPDNRLYGEWLVPHSLKTYRDDAWKNFYVFDVMRDNQHLSYEDYKHDLVSFGIDYIPPLAIAKRVQEEQLLKLLEKNGYLIKDGEGSGEGIVIKNYGFVNKYGRTTWAKIITNEFKEKHHKEMGAPEINGTTLDEEKIIQKYVTDDFILKEKAKITNTHGEWSSKMIPELLGRVWHEFIKEETVNFVKEFKNPKINFKFLNSLCIKRTKEVLGL